MGRLLWSHKCQLGSLLAVLTIVLVLKLRYTQHELIGSPMITTRLAISDRHAGDVEQTEVLATMGTQNASKKNNVKKLNLRCAIKGVPCEYGDEVDVRLIVLTYNRPGSLTKCLDALQKVILDNSTGAIEIWIDRSTSGQVHTETLTVAERFRWKHGPTTIHVWPYHVGVYGQWIDTWRPKRETREMAIFIEDDVDLSPFSVRWAMAARRAYGNRHDVGSIGLVGESVQISDGPRAGKGFSKPKDSPVFFYKMVGSWGMVPIAPRWRQFQDWYYEVRVNNPKFKPYTKGASLQTSWYRSFERSKRTHTMWTMWYIWFTDHFKLFTVYPNLGAFSKQKGASLAHNRKPPGLHFNGKEGSSVGRLLSHWNQTCIRFPSVPPRFDYDGQLILTGTY